MSFGKNPHVAKAETAEQKAREARDDIAREQAWREAARRWERAAERETDGKRRQLYLDRGEQARARAAQPVQPVQVPDEVGRAAVTSWSAEVKPKSTLN